MADEQRTCGSMRSSMGQTRGVCCSSEVPMSRQPGGFPPREDADRHEATDLGQEARCPLVHPTPDQSAVGVAMPSDPTQVDLQEVIDRAEAAVLLGVRREHVVKLLQRGVLPGKRLTATWVTTRGAVQAYAQQRRPRGRPRSRRK